MQIADSGAAGKCKEVFPTEHSVRPIPALGGG
jgi:hypothetical protein